MDVNFDFDEQLEKLGKIPRAARYGAVVGLLALRPLQRTRLYLLLNKLFLKSCIMRVSVY